MFRLLALLQLTRAALAFTAIADVWAVLLLRPPTFNAQRGVWEVAALGWHDFHHLVLKMVITGVVSVGLYGFGMALNDVLDARHDRIFAPRRPIPSGRVPVRQAMVVCLMMVLCSLLAAALLAPFSAGDSLPWSLLFALATAFLIVLYDATSKYLGGFGLVTLGAIRALHCLIGNPTTPLLFLSMFLLTHVIIVSTVAYVLENKRPRLRKHDYVVIVLGILIGDGLAIWYMWHRKTFDLELWPLLLGTGIAAALYVLWAGVVLLNKKLTRRGKGDRIMLLGLFWLFVYDWSMLFSNRQVLAGVAVVLLFVCAVISFLALRYLGRALGQQRLEYRAAEGGARRQEA